MRRSLGQWRDLPIELGHDLVINVLVGNIHLKELMQGGMTLRVVPVERTFVKHNT